MSKFKIYGKCEGCKKKKLFVRTRTIFIPEIKQLATNRDLLCDKCHERLNNVINPSKL